MPLKVIYVSVIWIPGSLAFANKKKKVFDSNTQGETEVASALMEEKALKLKQQTMSKEPLEHIIKDMYYEIYDSPDARYPRITSR